MSELRILIMGAAGRDFHDFNVVYRDDPAVRVVAFTATQIPGIAGRRYPVELAGRRYPAGIPIYPEAELERLIRDESIDEVVFAYSDVSHETVMHAASRAHGRRRRLQAPRPGPDDAREPPPGGRRRRGPDRAAARARRAATWPRLLEGRGLKVVVVRHPMPYGELAAQRVQRFATYADLDLHKTTIEEREEYEPHLDAGRIVYAGVDYEAILRAAEKEADVVLWDGGNNDLPFYKPDLYVVVADPLRPGHELHLPPGRDEPADGRRDRAQQDRLGRPAGDRPRPGQHRRRQPRRPRWSWPGRRSRSTSTSPGCAWRSSRTARR